MAPLYKRYIPPNLAASPVPQTLQPVSKSSTAVAPEDAPNKRKRERTEEEIAERKAKKLRKKGIDPKNVEQESKPRATPGKPARNDITAVNDESIEEPTIKPQGEFAHVKNAKKRHKLEKEARKARKAATQDAESVNEVNGQVVPETEDKVPSQQVEAHITQSKPSHSKDSTNGAHDHGAKAHSVDPAYENIKAQTREKTRKKEKKKSEEVAEAKDVGVGFSAPDGSEHVSIISQPKKRGHKLEAALKEARNTSPDQSLDSDDHLRKHAGVMNRFSQSKNQIRTATAAVTEVEQSEIQAGAVLDLAPLPQPDKAPTLEFKPDLSAIPRWLAEPTIVSSATQRGLAEFDLPPKAIQHLSVLGCNEAMPVQQALIPLLLPPGTPGARFLPGTEVILPDIAVGAPTGSGKTIAYLLPLIESLKATSEAGKLKALIVVPTRELVMQVAAVADSLARGSSIKVGMATGTGSFKDEQTRLIKYGRRYDPESYHRLMMKLHHRNNPPEADSDEFEDYLEELENQDVKEEKRIQDAVSTLIDHVPTYGCAVDILVATPGRLLEHLDKTIGINLAYLEWLILDEADQLVDQQYDGFLEAVHQELSRPRKQEEQDAREQFLRRQGLWNEQEERRVRKVVLSATMSRDISKIMELKLKRPQMLLVQGSDDPEGQVEIHPTGKYEFELPPTLVEHCVHVGDGSEKPLYLMELIDQRIFGGHMQPRKILENGTSRHEGQQGSDSSSSSSSDSDSSIESDTSSDDDSVYGQSSEDDGRESVPHSDAKGSVDNAQALHPDRVALVERFSLRHKASSAVPVVLVFVSSTESANRLAHLLRTLKPNWASYIRTMTRTESNKKGAFHTNEASEPTIAISTDRAARGLDSIGNKTITHVVQYDIPRSVTGYVHRVGRTARAGRRGEAWTLYSHSEARWFYNGICRTTTIKRPEAVEKVQVHVEGEQMREKFAWALEEMREGVYGESK